MIEGDQLMNVDSFHYNNTFKRLCPSDKGKITKDVVFPHMWELFVWAAILGYINKTPKKIEKRYSSPPFRWQVIKEPHQKLLIIMAVESVKKFGILKSPEELKHNIESYANGGLDLIQKELALDPLSYQNIEGLIYTINKRFK